MNIHALVRFAFILIVAGCVVTKDAARDAGAELLYSVGARGVIGKRLIPFTTLDGYISASGSGSGSVVRLMTGVGATKSIAQQPVAIGAGDNGVYIVDAANNSLTRFRWNDSSASRDDLLKNNAGLGRSESVRLGRLNGVEDPSDLFVAANGDLFVSDARGKKVVRFDLNGVQQQEYTDTNNLNGPVAVSIDSRGLRIFVADGLFDRIIVFAKKGMSLYGIGERGEGPGKFHSLRAMVQGRDGLLYVVSGTTPDIQIFGLDGTYIDSFGKGVVADPGGIAVDEDNRIFVSDRFDHRISVFAKRKLVETYGKFGKKPGEFNQPGRIAYHNGFLYVTDRQNARIQVFRVVPEKFIESMTKKDDAP